MRTSAFGFASEHDGPRLLELEVPDPETGQVRVRVEVATLNGFDTVVAAGRVWATMRHEFPVVLGRDFAGVVESTGPGVVGLAAGDRVCGVVPASPLRDGSLTGALTLVAGAVVPIPAGVDTEGAAALGLAGVTALDLVDALAVSAQDTVLVVGATGGVGLYAVQLAVGRGARVLATARDDRGRDLVLGVGAIEAVDYTGGILTAARAIAPDGVTAVVHAAGDPAGLGSLLRPGGRLASVLGASEEAVGGDVTVLRVSAKPTREKLESLLDAVAAGALRMPMTRTFPLVRASDALSHFTAHKVGKLLVDTR